MKIYIGNTTPSASKEVVGAVLMKCAKGLEPSVNLEVLEVVQLATHIENPRTKCWKIVVPYKFKEIMENDSLYPSGWCHRKFFSPRYKKNPAKHSRKEDDIVEEVIKEQLKKAAGQKDVTSDVVDGADSSQGQTGDVSADIKDKHNSS